VLWQPAPLRNTFQCFRRAEISLGTLGFFLGDKGNGTVTLVQASIVDLNDGWYRDCTKYIPDDSDDLKEALQNALGTDTSHTPGIDPEAIWQLRILARKMYGAVADEQPIIVCTHQFQSQNLVFVGQKEDIHLFLQSEQVRKELGITDWTQRGYTARDRTLSYFFNLCTRCGGGAGSMA